MTDMPSPPAATAALPMRGTVLVKPLRPLVHLVASLGTAVVVLILGALTYNSLTRVRASRAWVEHSHLTIDRTRGTLSDLKDAETGQRGFLLTGDETYLEPYTHALSALAADTSALRTLTRDNPAAQRRLDELAPLLHQKLAELDSTIVLRRGGLPAALAIVETNRGKETMDAVRSSLGALEADERQLLASRALEEERYSRIVTLVLVGGTLAAFVIAIVLNGMLTRYAESQAASARELDRRNEQLDEQNTQLEAQALELELQNQQLQDQASELELQQQHLQEQATELEAQNEQLQQQASELEMQTDELQAITEELEERTDDAERARTTAGGARVTAEAANRAKSDFLATMSHELRTPLNAIGGYVELMELGIRGPVTSEQMGDLSRIKRSGRHLLGLINDILNFAKLEAGKVEFKLTDVSVFELVAGVEALVAPQMHAKGIHVSYDRCDPGVMARGDAEKVQQILLNLLTNALKFTAPGGEIKISCAGHEDGVVISVGDTGRGIPAEKLDSVFEPFVQVDRQLASDSASTVHSGVGLGLAISRELARAMGGNISAESRVGVGSVFTLVLPLATGHVAEASHSANASNGRTHQESVQAGDGTLHDKIAGSENAPEQNLD
jgi:signal transduction histidine kinase